MSHMSFKVGDKVRHAHRFHAFPAGTVIQVEGGRDGDLTEVAWHDGDTLWHSTSTLAAVSDTDPAQSPNL